MHRRLSSGTLSVLVFPRESNPHFPWEKPQWDNTVVKIKNKISFEPKFELHTHFLLLLKRIFRYQCGNYVPNFSRLVKGMLRRVFEVKARLNPYFTSLSQIKFEPKFELYWYFLWLIENGFGPLFELHTAIFACLKGTFGPIFELNTNSIFLLFS